MKKLTLLLILIISGLMILEAQIPQAMKYKAIAKDEWGVSLPNKDISLRFTILQGSAEGDIVYMETHQTSTNKFGLMDVDIGKGFAEMYSFEDIDWSDGPYFIKIEMDPQGGINFRLEDTPHQLLSVPYALYAGSFTEADPIFSAWDKSTDISITESQISDLNHFTTADETDPVFGSHAASRITVMDITNWGAAFGWGAHAGLYRPIGYVPVWNEITGKPVFATVAISGNFSDLIDAPTNLSFFNNDMNFINIESDPVFTSSPAIGITSGNIVDWNTAFAWGNHSTAGYITDGNTGWDNSYGFITASSSELLTNKSGNISMWTNDAGYLTSYTEADPIFSAWNKSSGISITESQITDLDHFTINDEMDPLWTAAIPAYYDKTDFQTGIAQVRWESLTFMPAGFADGTDDVDDADADPTNELQVLSLTGHILSLSLDGTPVAIDLSPYMDNADDADADLTNELITGAILDGTTLKITDAGGTSSVDLSSLAGGTGSQTLSQVLDLGNDAGDKAIVNISQQGIGTVSPDASAALEINSTTQGFLPPRMTSAEREAISTPATGLMIFNTDENKWQGFNGTLWVNIDGSGCVIPCAPGTISGNTEVDYNAAGEVYSIASVAGASSYNWMVPAGATITAGQGTTSITVTFGATNDNVSVRAENECGSSSYTDLGVSVMALIIGQYHEGGIIFYLDGTGEHGLVCTEYDYSYGAWGCYETEISGADGFAIGAGAQNTIDIEAGCTTAGTAADICANLSLNNYDDWFLPSIYEIVPMYRNLHLAALGGFAISCYWSSTENSSDYAWSLSFVSGGMSYDLKHYSCGVRPVRAF